MVQEPGIVKGDALQKIGSAGFIGGAILLVVGNLLMPYTTKPTANLQEMLTPLGQQEFRTEAATVLIVLGIWTMMMGTAGVYRSITAGGAAWARLGFYLVLVGTALWTLSLSLDLAVAAAVAGWLAAPVEGREAAWGVVAALSAVGRGVVPVNWTLYWLALALLNIGMIGSAVYPRWLGWTGLMVSIPVIGVGLVQSFTARSSALTLIYVLLSLLTNLWALGVGIWVARKAW